MKISLPRDLLAATRLTRSGRLMEATAAIRRLLGRHSVSAKTAQPADAETYSPKNKPFSPRPVFRAPPADQPAPAARQNVSGAFLTRSFTNAAGTRPYRLYVPAGYRGQAVPLLLMLHGCTQSPEDFAVGTRMNLAAEAVPCLVAYPGQTVTANRQKCWNWFNANEQVRDAGEPSLLAGITREVMRDYCIDPRRVYVAGMSAGGAAADVLGALYPDLFAAVGVHSGLACGAAHDMTSAFAAMQNGSSGRGPRRAASVPTIVFHGDRDGVVNPRNANAVVAQADPGTALRVVTEEGRIPGGHSFTRTRHLDVSGDNLIEQWVVHGGGHAWFGGDPAGSYSDPRGPDASGEMLHFFLSHAHKR
jgi:poly(hydroxyalkanoate) depolymerase family esterase